MILDEFRKIFNLRILHTNSFLPFLTTRKFISHPRESNLKPIKRKEGKKKETKKRKKNTKQLFRVKTFHPFFPKNFARKNSPACITAETALSAELFAPMYSSLFVRTILTSTVSRVYFLLETSSPRLCTCSSLATYASNIPTQQVRSPTHTHIHTHTRARNFTHREPFCFHREREREGFRKVKQNN